MSGLGGGVGFKPFSLGSQIPSVTESVGVRTITVNRHLSHLYLFMGVEKAEPQEQIRNFFSSQHSCRNLLLASGASLFLHVIPFMLQPCTPYCQPNTIYTNPPSDRSVYTF